MTKNQTLIAEARRVEPRIRSTLDTTVADLVRDLADALEAREVAYTELLADYEAMKARVESEPAWEYGHEGDTLIGVHANTSRAHALEDAESLTRYWAQHDKKFRAVRRRAAGPWEPVEGEGKP